MNDEEMICIKQQLLDMQGKLAVASEKVENKVCYFVCVLRAHGMCECVHVRVWLQFVARACGVIMTMVMIMMRVCRRGNLEN